MALNANTSFGKLVLVSIVVVLGAVLLDWFGFHPTIPFLHNDQNVPTILVTSPQTKVSYRGTVHNDTEHFKSIFYAESTGGNNRFAPPVPSQPPPGTVVDATTDGAWCPQFVGQAPLPFTSPITNVSEHCLSLRIARPRGTNSTSRLPVLVWIHGGGNALGSAYDQLYQPDGIVRQANKNGQPVIWVGINYRLGIFGYGVNNALKEHKSANLGLRDQRAALEWVRDNIAAFGGEPQNVVAIGQSVGAMSVGLHLTSFQGERGVPFQKAIMMSGATGTNFNIMSDFVANNTITVAKSLDCIKRDPDSMTTIECLREVSMKKLMETAISLARSLHPPFGELVFYPTYDGDYITDRPSKLLRNGKFAKDIPIIASWTANDGAWYPSPSIDDDNSVVRSFQTYVAGFSETSLQRLLQLYPPSDFEHMVQHEGTTAQYYRAAQINRDMWFTCPVVDFSWQYVCNGGPGSSNIRLYEMNQTKFGPVFQYMGVPQWRTSHLSDIPYMLNEQVAAGGDNSREQQELSALLSGSAAAFAHTGDPTNSRGEVLQDWPLAFQNTSHCPAEHPEEIIVNVVGGPQGSGFGRVSGSGLDAMSAREKALKWEKINERCGFFNSILEEIGV